MNPISFGSQFITSIGISGVESIRSVFLSKYPNTNFIISHDHSLCVWTKYDEEVSFLQSTILNYVFESKNIGAINILIRQKRCFLSDVLIMPWDLRTIDIFCTSAGLSDNDYYVAEISCTRATIELSMQENNLKKVCDEYKIFTTEILQTAQSNLASSLSQYHKSEDEYYSLRANFCPVEYLQEDFDCAAWNRTLIPELAEKEYEHEDNAAKLALVQETMELAAQKNNELCQLREYNFAKWELAKKNFEHYEKIYFDAKLCKEWRNFKEITINLSFFMTAKTSFPNLFHLVFFRESHSSIFAFKNQ